MTVIDISTGPNKSFDDLVVQSLLYEPDTGDLFWKVSHKRRPAGSLAGCKTEEGYIRICIGGKQVFAHRAAWFLTTGKWPEKAIDHINLDPGDNRFSNLRLASASENQMNTRAKSPHGKGVTLHRTGRFQAQIKRGNTNFYLGLFASREEAHAAYCSAAKVLFGNFARPA